MMDVFNPHFVNRFIENGWGNLDEETMPMNDFRPGSEIVKTEKGFEVKVSLPGVKHLVQMETVTTFTICTTWGNLILRAGGLQSGVRRRIFYSSQRVHTKLALAFTGMLY